MIQDVEDPNTSETSENVQAKSIQEELENMMEIGNKLDLPSTITDESITLSTQKVFNLFINSESGTINTRYIMLIKSNRTEFVNYFIQQIQQAK